MNITRRDFVVKGGMGLLALGLAGPLGLLDWDQHIASAAAQDNILVVIQLSGGNDGLNTVVPYSTGAYYDNRPTLAIAQKDALHLDNNLGLHPSLPNLKKLYDSGNLAIINGVGYPNPNRSHFRSMEIWQTAAPDKLDEQTGWLGRYLDLTTNAAKNPVAAVTVGPGSKIFLAKNNDAPGVTHLDTFKLILRKAKGADRLRRQDAFFKLYDKPTEPTLILPTAKGHTAIQSSNTIQSVVKSATAGTSYPENSAFGDNLELIAQLVSSGLGTRTYFSMLDGFDDHSHEKDEHARGLKELDSALSAFYNDLVQRNVANRVTILVYSEFGRRVKENASNGTDHGTAGPVFVIGPQVQGGLYGQLPSLTQLDSGDLKYQVDFRSVYSTLLDKWLKAPSKDVLGGSFENLKFL
ncbi:DUF1501 domain-containing protein [Tumebacillus permanentifrigoris]|uniref:Uncharacterized protein (DUF1501 family) n=1 Tax=Tumebacillus permanentifrigoris TaxID=378543 RepID=A0A316DTW6_9BACL|nr:DUF1501 domain-containing protein [Tumebacillus permanentifrigoris]PWK11341.1 uncharacterized protein (DUF1501 family) [Tumebacillus permanentifrigoris]